MKFLRSFTAALLLLVGFTTASGVVNGRLEGRWGSSRQLATAGTRLLELPTQFGPWRMQSEEPLSAYAEEVLECSGYINRVYVHEETGQQVSVAVVVGPQGPIAVHTPEICYSSRDYRPQGERQLLMLRGSSGISATFWESTFQPHQSGSGVLKVYYGWNDGSGWSAAAEPRWAYLGKPYLYKLQLAMYHGEPLGREQENLSETFLKEFLVAVQPHLVSIDG